MTERQASYMYACHFIGKKSCFGKRTMPKFCFVECGLRPFKPRVISRRKRRTKRRIAKIVGGNSAEYGMFPWQVGIREVKTGTRQITEHHCGGIIISRHWILSAAHCFSR
jgi:secreted trypsin-like serine protease